MSLFGSSDDDIAPNKLDFTLIDTFLDSHFISSEEKEEGFLSDVAILKEFLIDPPPHLLGDDLLKQIESMLRQAVSIIAWYDFKDMDDEMAAKLSFHLATTLCNMSGLKSGEDPTFGSVWISRLSRVYNPNLKPLRDYYPKTDQLGFVDHLAEYLEQLIEEEGNSIGPLKLYTLRFKQKLQNVSSRVMKIPLSLMEDAYVKDLIQSITNLAYQVEYAIDLYLVGEIPAWYCMIWLRDVLIDFRIQERKIEIESGDILSIVTDLIQNQSSELRIIPIVSNSEVSDNVCEFLLHLAFQFRTWASVSSYKEKKREVFLQLLDNALPPNLMYDGAYASDMSSAQLESLIYTLLEGGRYFVMLKDMEAIDTLNDIVRAFPARFGRVLVTTPSREVAIQCRSFSQTDILNEMRLDHTPTSETNMAAINHDVVGFLEEKENMFQMLFQGSKPCRIISIVGMAGQGKTTLARMIYNSSLTVHYFQIHLWCYISQVYEKKGVLLELLGQLVQLSYTIYLMSDEELGAMLYKHLKGRRFLVVLDDVWEVDAWNDIKGCFPDDANGSRIVFTTRIRTLASQANSNSVSHQLRLLSNEESWELLKKKVFQGERCPEALSGVGKKIASSCKGLPLSVILIAGILGKMNRNVDNWKHIANDLYSLILADKGARERFIIEMSYSHLLDHLKPCFLYFGIFLVGREVSVQKLIRLWIAEGFIEHTDLKSLEDVGEYNLTDLIGRSLVTVAQETSIGGIKLCRMHDLLHEFCLIKAREENFLQKINGCDEQIPFSRIYPPRLCICSKTDQYMLEHSGPFVRSLFYAASYLGSGFLYDISFIFRNFKFVRTLDLEDIKIGESFEVITVLVLLRYLAVQCCVDSIPSSIANLWNLETFIFKGLSAKIVKVPDSIWDMAMLRHVHINDNASFDLVPRRLEMFSILDNLQTFSAPSLAYGNDMEKLLKRLPGIRKLKCIFLESWDNVPNCYQLPDLKFLHKLVSLKVCYNGMVNCPCKFKLPSSLKRLTLSNFRMPWNEVSQLSILPNLEVLKLEGNAFDGEKWETGDEVFPKLKLLKLDNLNVVEWIAVDDHFPCLERLILHNCRRLEEIPSSIGDIPTLQLIEVMWCSPSLESSARAIQEEQQEYGNEELQIRLYPNP